MARQLTGKRKKEYKMIAAINGTIEITVENDEPSSFVKSQIIELVQTDVMSQSDSRIIGMYHFEWSLDKQYGKITKRIAKYVKDQYSVNLSPATKSEIGNLVANETLVDQNFEFDITDVFDWEVGEFDDDSCFWRENTSHRAGLEVNGGLAIRFFDGSNGVARAWMWAIDDENIAIFNAYGMNNKQIGRILGQHLGARVQYNVDIDGEIYTNGDCCVVGPNAESIESVYVDCKPDHDHEYNYDTYRCENCNDYVPEDDMHSNEDGQVFCVSCYNNLYLYCGECEQEHDRDSNNGIRVEKQSNYSGRKHTYTTVVCDECAKKNYDYVECAICAELTDGYTVTNDSEEYCDECAEKHLKTCSVCSEAFDTDDYNILVIDGESFCEDCVADNDV